MSPLALLEPLLPTTCAVCGLPGGHLCERCRGLLRGVGEVVCAGCGAPLGAPAARCGQCEGPVAGARQAVHYDPVARALVSALKDGRRPALAGELAGVVVQHLPVPALGCVLVPVPTSPARVRRRGFDHAALLARELGARWGRPVVVALVRPAGGPPQRGARRGVRRSQLAGAFAPAGGAAPRHPVLVDDVRTTGATLAACARTLRAGGARSVAAVCVARAGGGP
ncbi:MAG: double zinc ribbon domain-containing protein [Miltoncostaeaceae bacterium]